MNILKYALLSLLLTASALWAEPTVSASPSVIDPVVEALPILQAGCPDFATLNYKPGDKLQDLVARSNGEISLLAPDTLPPTPIITAVLPDGVVYWRLASFTPKTDWPTLGTELQKESQHDAHCGAVLDLRSNEAPQDIRGAAQIVRFFAPGDDSLKRYNLKDADGNLLSCDLALKTQLCGPIVVLTNQQTTGAAEALAACLQADGALVIGATTAGKAADFVDHRLASGQVLRFVADHVHTATGSDTWNHPVTPDISLSVNDHAEKAALTLIRDNHILDVIQESAERHRLSEASLVQGQDPEFDEYLSSLEQKPFLLSLPVVHDPVLISALDSLKAIRLSQRTVPTQSTATASLPTSTSIQ